jgi:hypothetical protein
MAKSRGRVFDYLSATGSPARGGARAPTAHGKVGVAPPGKSRDACSHARSDSELTSGSSVLLVVRRHLIQRGDRFARIPFMRGGA